MIELKPRCEGCGTPNTIDAIFCQECGVGLNVEHNDDMSIPNEPFEEITIRKGLDGRQTKKKNSLDHLRDKGGKFIVKDKRLDFRSMEIPDWEFPRNQVKKTLKEEIEDLDWKVPIMDGKVEFTPLTDPPQKGGIIKTPNARPEEIRHFVEAYKIEMEKAAKDPHYVPLLATNKDIEFVPFTTTSNLTPQPPYSAIIGTDVRKGITPLREKSSGLDRPVPIRHIRKPWGAGKCDCDGITSICDEFRAKQKPILPDYDMAEHYIKSRKRPKKQNPKEYITIKKSYNSKLLWLFLIIFPITIWSVIIYLSIFT